MIKFCSIREIPNYIGWYLCESLSADGNVYPKYTKIDSKLNNIISVMDYKESIETYIVISSLPKFTEEELRDFLIHAMSKFSYKELEVLNTKYFDIFTESIGVRAVRMIENCAFDLNCRYLTSLICNPSSLRKSLDLALLSFYFALKLDLKYKEIEDIVISALLVNLCIDTKCILSIIDIEDDKDFLQMYKTAKEHLTKMIDEDNSIDKNVKRIVYVYNISNSGPDKDAVSGTLQNDIMLEILWLSNDLLTYSLGSDKDFKRIYSSDKYPIIKPELNFFFNNFKINEKKSRVQSFFNKFTGRK